MVSMCGFDLLKCYDMMVFQLLEGIHDAVDDLLFKPGVDVRHTQVADHLPSATKRIDISLPSQLVTCRKAIRKSVQRVSFSG